MCCRSRIRRQPVRGVLPEQPPLHGQRAGIHAELQHRRQWPRGPKPLTLSHDPDMTPIANLQQRIIASDRFVQARAPPTKCHDPRQRLGSCIRPWLTIASLIHATRPRCTQYVMTWVVASLTAGRCPSAGTQWGCAGRVAAGSVPNEHGTWQYGRAGWCDGQQVGPRCHAPNGS